MRNTVVRVGIGVLLAVFITALTAAQYAVLKLVPVAEQPADVETAPLDETPSAWFVELAGRPVADGGDRAAVRREKAAFRAAARAAGVRFTERQAFDTLWNGLSVRVNRGDLTKLARMGGVAAVYPVLPVSLPPHAVLTPSDPALVTALAMTGSDIAQNSMGLTGEGIRVAIIDSGVDFNHPDLGACFGPGCRVENGYDFVGDAFNADSASPNYNPTVVPDEKPDDCNGHGTHVAGIVGANGAVRGVAPDVTIHAYRVFGCEGATFSDILLAAMERALADGADVLNMSVGADFQWPHYPTASAADRLVNKGVVVVASMGNAGAAGLYGTSAPASGHKVIGVASVENAFTNQTAFTVSPDQRRIGYSSAIGAFPVPISGKYTLARTGSPSVADDGCAAFPSGSLKGKAVLIRRGTCSFYEKALNAKNAAASLVILYNNGPGLFTPTVEPTVEGGERINIPVVAINAEDGALIDARIAEADVAAGNATVTWTTDVVSTPSATGGVASSFSSFGLAADLTLKPDISAPGGPILSTYPVSRGNYASISGTSMSAPHVSGAIALLLQARPHTPPLAVRALLQATARPQRWWGNPALGFLDNVHRQGAGTLRIEAAISSPLTVEPSGLSVGESEAGPAARTLTFSNHGPADITLALSHEPALSTGPNTFAVEYLTAFAAASFSRSVLVVPAGGGTRVDVTITANAGLPQKSLYGGYIIATDVSAGVEYRVPYSGFGGDYQSIRVLAPTKNEFPWLAQVSGGTYLNQSAGAVFTLAGSDQPYVLVHFDHQPRKVRMSVSDANTGRSWHRMFEADYFGRNSTATSFFAFPFDGVTYAGNKSYLVPDGSYAITLSVLKALGDDDNPDHWETWTSPMFVIARP